MGLQRSKGSEDKDRELLKKDGVMHSCSKSQSLIWGILLKKVVGGVRIKISCGPA